MSNQKSKQKDKKTQAHIEVENKLDELMSEHLDKDRILKATEEKANRLGMQLYEVKTQNSKLKTYIKEQFQKLTLTIDNLKGRLTELTTHKNQLELQVATLKAKLDFEKKDHEQWRKQKERQYDDSKRQFATEIGKYQAQASQYAISINERQALMDERAKLLEMIDIQREQFKHRLADRDRNKIQALDTLKKDSRDKCAQMKLSLLSIRREQLDNNTRLTLLQNHQLIQELEYQSLNTEKIVDRNNDLQKKVKELQTELDIKRDIEKEIVKRTFFSKKIIETFQNKNSSLEKDQQDMLKDKEKRSEKIENYDKLAATVSELSKALDSSHGKLQTLEKELTLKNTQLSELSQINQTYKTKCSGIVHLLCKYYQDTLSQKYHPDSQTQINLEQIKAKDVSEWSTWEVKTVAESILNQLKQHLTPNHLDMEAWRKVADSRVKQVSGKENIEEEIKQQQKCNSEYIRSLSLQKNKLFYQNKRKLSAKSRSLTKVPNEHTVSFCRYVQGNLREWGPQIKADVQKSLADRFMKPIKNSLKK